MAISGADMFFHREIYDFTVGFDEKIFNMAKKVNGNIEC